MSSNDYLRAWRKANADRIKAYREATREKRNAQWRLRASTPDAKAQRSVQKAKWHQRNRERVLARKRDLRAANPHWNDAAIRKYCESYPERRRELASRRRKSEQSEKVDYAKVLADSMGQCGICHQPIEDAKIHFDHVVPLARGGRHTQTNIQVAHARCNLKKGAQLNY